MHQAYLLYVFLEYTLKKFVAVAPKYRCTLHFCFDLCADVEGFGYQNHKHNAHTHLHMHICIVISYKKD